MMHLVLVLSLLVSLTPIFGQSRCFFDAQKQRMICCDNYGMCI